MRNKQAMLNDLITNSKSLLWDLIMRNKQSMLCDLITNHKKILWDLTMTNKQTMLHDLVINHKLILQDLIMAKKPKMLHDLIPNHQTISLNLMMTLHHNRSTWSYHSPHPSSFPECCRATVSLPPGGATTSYNEGTSDTSVLVQPQGPILTTASTGKHKNAGFVTCRQCQIG